MLPVVPVALAAIAGLRSLWSPCGLSVAETTYLRVRGVARAGVVAVLILSGALTGGGLAALAGWAWAGSGAPSAGAFTTATIVAVAVALDVFRVPVLAVGRQLPTAWGRIFGPYLGAALYGARLGVGPATILMTWQWWAAMILAITHGPVIGFAAGAVFQLARVAAIAAAVSGATDPVHAVPGRMARIQRADVAGGIAASTASAALCALVLF